MWKTESCFPVSVTDEICNSNLDGLSSFFLNNLFSQGSSTCQTFISGEKNSLFFEKVSWAKNLKIKIFLLTPEVFSKVPLAVWRLRSRLIFICLEMFSAFLWLWNYEEKEENFIDHEIFMNFFETPKWFSYHCYQNVESGWEGNFIDFLNFKSLENQGIR